VARKTVRKAALRKVVDETSHIRGKSGVDGILREEVFQDSSGRLVKYNLAFIHFGLCPVDNGRVLGYDNAHGIHERHWMGSSDKVDFISYENTLARFLDEVAALREKI
jgi:hypothetical protein